MRWRGAPCALVLGIALAACRGRGGRPALGRDGGPPALAAGDAGSPPVAAPPADPLASLRAFEAERRRAADFAHLLPSDRALGPDPIAIRALPGSPQRFVGLLRGRDAVVLLDASLHEIARAAAPALPTGLSVTEDGEIVVSGEQAPVIGHTRATGDALRGALGGLPVPRLAHGFRDVAVGHGRGGRIAYAVDEREGTLVAMPLDRARGDTRIVPACAGAFRVARAGDQLVVDCLLDHTLAVFDLDAGALPVAPPRARIQHDGPIWGFQAVQTPHGLLIAAGGVEDHPLDRTEGSFGFVDSFVFLYRVLPGLPPERLAAINVSEHGVITPKAILLSAGADGGATVLAAGYGSDRLAEITWPSDLTAPPSVTTLQILPGVASMAVAGDLLVCADPLFDAWFSVPLEGGGHLGRDPRAPGAPPPLPLLVPVADPGAAPRDPHSRVGEALFFTNLMAPWNLSEGRLSRFTCETCHFEGYADGRTHATGRGDVHATTKPLLGLFNNRPHFSRALDPDLTTMIDNEFRAAGARSGHEPWFTAEQAGLAWTALLGVPVAELDGVGLRRALMGFLMDFTHRPNPAALGRTSFTGVERRGAEVFARRCEGCHAARLVADDPATRLPPSSWESLVLSREGPLVWGSSGYRLTGIEPYVHPAGARTPSLRRLYKKRPYFTNGSAPSLREVLERARFQPGGDGFWHDRAPDGSEGLGDEERRAVGAFLELL